MKGREAVIVGIDIRCDLLSYWDRISEFDRYPKHHD